MILNTKYILFFFFFERKQIHFLRDVFVAVAVVVSLGGTLRNHDDDGNGNVKKNDRFKKWAKQQRFFVHFFAFTAQLRREMTKF